MAKTVKMNKKKKDEIRNSVSKKFLSSLYKAVEAIYGETGVVKDDTVVAAKRIKDYLQSHGGTSHSRNDIVVILNTLIGKQQLKLRTGKKVKGEHTKITQKGGVIEITGKDGNAQRLYVGEPLKQVSGIVTFDKTQGYFIQPTNPKYKSYKIQLHNVSEAKKHLGKLVGAKIIAGDNGIYDAQIERGIEYQSINGVVRKEANGEYYLQPIGGNYKHTPIKIVDYGKVSENVGKVVRVRVLDFNDGVYNTTVDRTLEKHLIPGIVRVRLNGSFYLEPVEPEFKGATIELIKDEETRGRLGKLVGAKYVAGSNNTVAVVEKTLEGNEFTSELISRIFAEIYDLGISTMPEPEQLKKIMEEFRTLPKIINSNEVATMKSKYPNFVDERGVPFVCIDPIGCKERDDAVYTKKLTEADGVEPELVGGYLEEIAISLVGEFMLRLGKDSETFKYISQVCTNTYVADMVFTMFLKEFNEGMGSLNPGEDRLAMVTRIYRDQDFNPVKTEIFPGVVTIKAVLAYEEQDYINEYKDYLQQPGAKTAKILEYQKNINKIFSQFNLEPDELDEILRSTDTLRELNKGLRPLREKNGTMDFRTIELNYRLNSSRTGVESVHSDNATEAHKMIETPMLSANIAMAELARDIEIPFVYRVEPRIEEQSIDNIRNFLEFVGLPFYAGDECGYAELNQAINQAVYAAYKKHGAKFAHVVSTKIICSLPKAEYSTEANLGHSALNFDCYAHTTSPDRRGADTLNQMQLLTLWETGCLCFSQEELDEFCKQANICERNADEAERNSDKILNVFHVRQMMEKGDESLRQNGCVTRVDRHQIEVITDYGYVTIPLATFEGMSPFKLHPNCLQITHQKNGNLVYRVGQSILVEPVKASIEDKTVYGQEVRTKKSPERMLDEIDKDM